MHLHLDPIGGIAGDMFAAAVLDAFPSLEEELCTAFAASSLGAYARIARIDHDDGALSGSRFVVEAGPEGRAHAREAAEVARIVDESGMSHRVRARAADIFSLLADAESRVHGIPVDAVRFHEVGSWDSIADVVCAAWLIEALGASGWSSAALPLGRGRVDSAHGALPVPAPATVLLLQEMEVCDDGHPGERVTPTGAAILRHLSPSFAPIPGPLRLAGSGSGFGTRRIEGMSNVLRLLALEPVAEREEENEQVTVCSFEIDDQTPEDLAVALERLRAREGVLDVLQAPVFGKKGRVGAQVQVLVLPRARAEVVREVFGQTTTLGVRWHEAKRTALPRDALRIRERGATVRVKRAHRPRGIITVKAEMDDIAALAGDGRAAREALRREAERNAGAGAAPVRDDEVPHE